MSAQQYARITRLVKDLPNKNQLGANKKKETSTQKYLPFLSLYTREMSCISADLSNLHLPLTYENENCLFFVCASGKQRNKGSFWPPCIRQAKSLSSSSSSSSSLIRKRGPYCNISVAAIRPPPLSPSAVEREKRGAHNSKYPLTH